MSHWDRGGCILTKKDRQNIAFVMEGPANLVSFQDRERVIKRLRQASILFPGTWASTASKPKLASEATATGTVQGDKFIAAIRRLPIALGAGDEDDHAWLIP